MDNSTRFILPFRLLYAATCAYTQLNSYDSVKGNASHFHVYPQIVKCEDYPQMSYTN